MLIVGTGFIAQLHAAAVAAQPRARLAGVADVDGGRAASFAYSHGGCRWTTDLAEALAWPDVDGVILCTPNDTHLPLGLAIARAGKHLLAEKPLATTVPHALEITQAFAAAGRVVAAAHTHRCYDYSVSVKSAIDAGAIGRPQLARLAILGGWIWNDWHSWMIDPARSGGHSLHNGVHLLDVVTWWLGQQPRTVYARGRRQTDAELGIYDYLEMTVGYAGGGTATCEISRGHRFLPLGYRELMVAGSDGIVEGDWDGEGSLAFGEAGVRAIPPAGRDAFAAQLAAWLSAVDGAEPLMTPGEAVQAVAMGVASELSMARGEPVEIAEVYPQPAQARAGDAA